MKAIVYEEYGSPDVLRLEEIAKPVINGDQVLVKTSASSITYSDLAFVKGQPFVVRLVGSGLRKPRYRIPGVNIAGTVEKVDRNVTRFKPGDEVFGDLSLCGRGSFAEYALAGEDALEIKPANITFEEAAAVPQAAVVALQGLRKAGIRSGNKVLVAGASGGIGTFVVQIAKSCGADVTGVCGPQNIEMVYSLGADHVIDYTQEDFTQNGQYYDVIIAAAGYRSIFDYRRSLSPDGRYVMTGGSPKQVYQAMLGPLVSSKGNQKLSNLAMKPNLPDLHAIKDLIEAGKVKPVVDRTYPLSNAAEAMKYYGTGHARGVVVISVATSSDV